MIVRTIAFVCDKCHKQKSLPGDNIFDLPEGWIAENIKYGFPANVEQHICPKCIEKRQIEEAFK